MKFSPESFPGNHISGFIQIISNSFLNLPMLSRLTFLLSFTVLLGSCFHKNVMEDRADDIKCVLLYSDNSGARIIAREEIFQATSKSSGRGITRISGYSEYRLSAYDVATGELLARVELGEGQKEGECLVLGIAHDKIWLFSMNPELGFHTRSPKTLEVIQTQEQITAAAPFAGFKFAVCEWPLISRHYGMSADQKNVMVTDLSGFRYRYNPQTGTLEKTNDEIVCNDNWTSTNPAKNSSMQWLYDSTLNLSGEPRRLIQHNYKPTAFQNSYLNGEFLMSSDLRSIAGLQYALADKFQRQIDSVSAIIKSIQQEFPRLAPKTAWLSDMSPGERDAYYKLGDLQRDTAELMRDKKDVQRQSSSFGRYTALRYGHDAFIWHCSDVTDTGKTLLTSLEILSGSQLREKWTLRLNRYFFNPDKADAAGAFETVFSDGNPQFRFQWFEVSNDKLIAISQLQMCCIDLKTGKLLWDKDL